MNKTSTHSETVTSYDGACYEYTTGLAKLPQEDYQRYECWYVGAWLPHSKWSEDLTLKYLKTAQFRRTCVKASGESELQGLTFALTVLDRAILVLPEIFKPGQRVRYTVEVV